MLDDYGRAITDTAHFAVYLALVLVAIGVLHGW